MLEIALAKQLKILKLSKIVVSQSQKGCQCLIARRMSCFFSNLGCPYERRLKSNFSLNP